MIKEGIIKIVNSLATGTNDIQLTIKLLNKFPILKTDKIGDIQTLRNNENFKSTLKDAVKDNIDRIHIYLNDNNLHFKPEIFEDIYDKPLTTSGSSSGSGNQNLGTVPKTQPT